MTHEHICPECGRVNEVRKYDSTVKYELGEITAVSGGSIEAPVEVWETKQFSCKFCDFSQDGGTEVTAVGWVEITANLTGMSFTMAVDALRTKMHQQMEKPPEAHL